MKKGFIRNQSKFFPRIMVKIKDNGHYEDTLKELKALEEQTKEMQKVLDEYNSYDDLPDELEDMRNQLIEFRKKKKIR